MSDEQKKPDAPAGSDMRETGVVNVMTSTSIHKHPTAFFNTRLPVLEVALRVVWSARGGWFGPAGGSPTSGSSPGRASTPVKTGL